MGTMNAGLPEGWTIDRVRRVSGDSEAAVLSVERSVVVSAGDNASYTPLQPDTIISFHGLCLARADDEWFMRDLEANGSVTCWACYGSDLERAIQSL